MGYRDTGLYCDHINHTLDNREENLRICTHSNNASNSKHYVNNTSGYNVNGIKSREMDGLMINRRHKTLGYFDIIEVLLLVENGVKKNILENLDQQIKQWTIS